MPDMGLGASKTKAMNTGFSPGWAPISDGETEKQMCDYIRAWVVLAWRCVHSAAATTKEDVLT